MGFGIKILVEGSEAMFTRPGLRVERLSYPVPTPSSMSGLLASVYNHPGLVYHIDRIVVYNDIAYKTVCKSEVKNKASYTKVKSQIKANKGSVDGVDNATIFATEVSTQRRNVFLSNVRYGIEAHFSFNENKDKEMNDAKAYSILQERLKKGGNFEDPFLGCRECQCEILWTESLPESELQGEVDLGIMLYDIQYPKGAIKLGRPTKGSTPRFYHPYMVDGVIDIKKYAEREGIKC